MISTCIYNVIIYIVKHIKRQGNSTVIKNHLRVCDSLNGEFTDIKDIISTSYIQLFFIISVCFLPFSLGTHFSRDDTRDRGN